MNLFEELDFKFRNIDTGIENKRHFVENFYNDQNSLLNKHFNTEVLLERYSNGFNNYRQILLDQKNTTLRLEINHVNDLKNANNNNDDHLLSLLNELKDTRNLRFEASKLNSIQVYIRRLIIREFKFRTRITTAQLIKYKNILIINSTFFRFLSE